MWERLVNDPTMSESVDTIESDRDGHLIMSPPPRPFHRIREDRINQLLKRLLQQGDSLTEGTVSTPQGVKVPDVVWYRAERSAALEAEGDDVLPNVVPDLCVEVLSPSNTDEEIGEKVAACFAAGVREVWICQRDGKMGFRGLDGPLDQSVICPEFPDNVPAKFLRP